MPPKALWKASQLDLSRAPMGTFRYASLAFAQRNLPPEVVEVIERMAEGLTAPRVTYRFLPLKKGEATGNLDWHCDGQQKATEIHRLLCIGTEDTEGHDRILERGFVWEYDGSYLHRPAPTEKEETTRLLLRVSQTEMLTRNFWQEPPTPQQPNPRVT